MATSDKYKKHTHREHVLELPDTYIGSIENTVDNFFVVDGTFVRKSINYNPGFYKLFDEILVNAHDHAIRLAYKKSPNPVKHIEFTVTPQCITVRNDGEGIDVDMHPEHKMYVPQLIFSELLTSTNYDKKELKIVGGKNGYGIKLVNIFSNTFKIDLVDSTRKLKYVQTFKSNMTEIGVPKITSSSAKSYTEIEFNPDFSRFGFTEISADMIAVLQRRVYDLAGTIGKDVKITWNGTPVKFKSFAEYSSWYVPNCTILADAPKEHWQIAVADNPFDKHFVVSFVNGIWTKSGKHVDEIVNQIVSHFTSFLEIKKKIKVKPAVIKDALAVFINCSVENPSFNSQTKEVMTTKVSCKIDEKFLKKLEKQLVIIDKCVESQSIKDDKENKKTDGKKKTKITIPKLDDAEYAGGKKSSECILILTEGDSAKTMAISGLTTEQRKYYGIFPLKGKLLNVKDTTDKKVEQTAEIANLKKIIGLESGREYTDVSDLRYGKILIMTDQDYDGSHIRGLLINMFHELWHTLIKIPGFLTYMATPIVKATKKTDVRVFYTQFEYEEWAKTNPRGYTVKYYKGLGTSTKAEALQYFKNLNVFQFGYDETSDEKIDLAFNKKRADDRKDWLKTHDNTNIICAKLGESISYTDFIDKDLIHFSAYNVERAIPSVMDGLKTSQRKILFSAFKRNLKSEIKVAQFAGYVSEHSGYHHGEASLNEAIIGMAHDFVGSNNIPLLVPQGQFGSRIGGGSDHASPRYIFTYLQPQTTKLFPAVDFDCLKYRDDDGMQVEPEWYAPILPMILINGSRGIGTGYSTYIPCFNPDELADAIKTWLKTGTGLDREFAPYYRGFTGKITRVNAQEYSVTGVWTVKKDEWIITELPVETWTEDFHTSLESLLAEGKILDFTKQSTDDKICIRVRVTEDTKGLEKLLTSRIKLSNMHAFNSKLVIQKYSGPSEILREYAEVRLDLYARRREYILKMLRDKLPYHENIVRFIRQQCLDKPLPDLRRKERAVCDKLLEEQKFDKIGGYDYLMNLPIASLTLNHAIKHEKDLEELKQKIAELEKKTAHELWLDELSGLV